MRPWSLLVRFCEPHSTTQRGCEYRSGTATVSQVLLAKLPVAVTPHTATRVA